jgi:hypothetical protein
VGWEPFKPLAPLQAPDAAHEVALVLVHVSVEEAPAFTMLGAAASVTTGALLETVTVADCVAVPPAPVQVNSYSVVFESAPVDQVPLVGTLPCQSPLVEMQELAPVDFQLSVELPPLLTVVGVAVTVTVGAEGAGAVPGAAAAAIETATD